MDIATGCLQNASEERLARVQPEQPWQLGRGFGNEAQRPVLIYNPTQKRKT
ncbi:MAG: hypothetical protein AAF085_15360 [Planctomycetota bacterium]